MKAQWQQLQRKRAESDASVPDAPARAGKFVQRYTEIPEDLKKDPKSHGSPLDCILLCRLREQVLRELGFQDIFKKVKDEENAKAISLFENVVDLNDAIEDEVKTGFIENKLIHPNAKGERRQRLPLLITLCVCVKLNLQLGLLSDKLN